MLDEVSEGYFNPDAPRGQQIRAVAGIAGDQVEPHSDDDMASSSESSGDEEEPEHSEDEAAAAKELGDWPGRVAVSRLPESAEFFRNVQSRVIHLAADEAGTNLGCGRAVSTQYKLLSGRPTVLHPRCKQCFRRFVV